MTCIQFLHFASRCSASLHLFYYIYQRMQWHNLALPQSHLICRLGMLQPCSAWSASSHSSCAHQWEQWHNMGITEDPLPGSPPALGPACTGGCSGPVWHNLPCLGICQWVVEPYSSGPAPSPSSCLRVLKLSASLPASVPLM